MQTLRVLTNLLKIYNLVKQTWKLLRQNKKGRKMEARLAPKIIPVKEEESQGNWRPWLFGVIAFLVLSGGHIALWQKNVILRPMGWGYVIAFVAIAVLFGLLIAANQRLVRLEEFNGLRPIKKDDGQEVIHG